MLAVLTFSGCGPSTAEKALLGTWVVDTVTVAPGAEAAYAGDEDAAGALAQALFAGVTQGMGLRYEFRRNGTLRVTSSAQGITLGSTEAEWEVVEALGDTAAVVRIDSERDLFTGQGSQVTLFFPEEGYVYFRTEDLVTHWRRR